MSTSPVFICSLVRQAFQAGTVIPALQVRLKPERRCESLAQGPLFIRAGQGVMAGVSRGWGEEALAG